MASANNKLILSDLNMLEAEEVSIEELICASNSLRSLRENDFYRKQELAAAEMGFSIKYI